MTGSDDILLDRQDGLALVTLNRPKALNAFTLGMYRIFDPALIRWATDPTVRAVLVRGAGGRAFCAGGDVRAIYDAGRETGGPGELTRAFFREEYTLIRRVARYPKPYIALIDGITMGGGVGVSVHGAYRIAGDRTLFAMPETGIGLFPDIGATLFLNRCPGKIGLYLGLTGHRLKAADALYCGIATHYVPSARIDELTRALAELHWRAGDERHQIDAVLAEFASDPGPAPLAEKRAIIDRCFAAPSVEAILDNLARETGADAAWAEETRADLLQRSPTSLKITFRQLQDHKGVSIEEALSLEYRMTQHVMRGHDFFEGVRALIVDKDQNPQWRPPSLAEVDEAMVWRYFEPIGEGELRFN